jgi:hypothetical protein
MSLTHSSDEAINRTAALLGRYVPGEALGAVEHEAMERRVERVHKRGSVRFILLTLTLIATAVIVIVAMFETLYYVMG